jgi:hypothetical protein
VRRATEAPHLPKHFHRKCVNKRRSRATESGGPFLHKFSYASWKARADFWLEEIRKPRKKKVAQRPQLGLPVAVRKDGFSGEGMTPLFLFPLISSNES